MAESTPSQPPDQQYSPKPNILERRAADYLKKQYPRVRYPTQDCSNEERAALKRANSRAITWAAVAGVLSGGIIGGMEWFMRQGMLDGMEDMTLMEQLPYWAGFSVVAGIVSLVEILFLYWNALRGVAKTSQVAGIPLQDSEHARLLLSGMSRVALELPSPRHCIYGIDPYAQMGRWKLAAISVMYRMKVGVSSFILRVLLRRVFGRMAMRGLLPLATGPLYAIWNAIITWRIMRKAKVQALGPYTIETLMHRLETDLDQLGDTAREVILQGMGEMIMRNQDAHPNHIYLLSRLLDAFDVSDRQLDIDWPSHQRQLGRLNEVETRWVLETMTIATVLSGKWRGRPRRFLQEVHEASGATFDEERIKTRRKQMLEGRNDS
ncbi:LBF_2804 family protein [Halomonas chromatireducens]|uniref:Uncharacterized protein n=1 Tax=Halomonas chromatireducens TaxID=507626 RepID=A0A0X8HD82_9GAMM|nr:hypothetical protein [Halomonas chromatireducens]AMD00508.1 hypothetical protein LOKO_01440 [Halomonas chromatireducens]